MSYSLFYAKDENEDVVYIEDVETGLACNCYCPYCKEKLVAKNQGTMKEHHFAHYTKQECNHGYETSLHLLAKEIFKECKTVFIPGTEFMLGNKQFIAGTFADIQAVELERKIGSIIPDITIVLRSNEIVYIEIKVTHGIDTDKYEEIKRLGLNVIEIDVSEIHHSITKDELYNMLFDNTYMKWVYNTQHNHYKNLLLDLVNVKEAKLLNDKYIIDYCPRKNKQVEIDNTCKQCDYHFKTKNTSLLDFLTVNCLKDFNMQWSLDDITSIDVRKHHRVINFKNNNYKSIYFDRLKPDNIYNIWKRYGLNGGGFIENVQEGYGLYLSTPPLKQYDKYNGKIYGTFYKRGKLIDSRQIYYANEKQWILVGPKDIKVQK